MPASASVTTSSGLLMSFFMTRGSRAGEGEQQHRRGGRQYHSPIQPWDATAPARSAVDYRRWNTEDAPWLSPRLLHLLLLLHLKKPPPNRRSRMNSGSRRCIGRKRRSIPFAPSSSDVSSARCFRRQTCTRASP